MAPIEIFVSEGNVDIYLSKLHEAWDAEARDKLLRLLIAEESRMGFYREHLENSERRVAAGLERIRFQRELVDRLTAEERPTDTASGLLETLEKAQALLEAHCQRLRNQFEQSKL
jgi:hypothetical protein